MLTGQQFAFLASALIGQSEGLSVAARLRPEGFVNVSTFGTPTLTSSGVPSALRPEGFVNVSTFGTPALISTPPGSESHLRPEGFSNSSTFGTPVIRPLDDFSMVAFLAHFTGTDEQTTQTDHSTYGKTITMTGGAKIDDAVLHPDDSQPTGFKDASNDVVTVPHDANWWGASESLCMEGEFYWPALPSSGDRFIMGKYRSVTNGRGLALYLSNLSGAWQLRLYRQLTSTTGQAFVTAAFEPTPGQFYHIAASRDKATDDWRIFVDGVMLVKVNDSAAITTPSQAFSIGAQNDGATHQQSIRFREIRVWKGTPHYNSDGGFTPPSVPYPES